MHAGGARSHISYGASKSGSEEQYSATDAAAVAELCTLLEKGAS